MSLYGLGFVGVGVDVGLVALGSYDNSGILFIIHVPNTTHMISILSPPLCMTHRSALQCGSTDVNGDMINPWKVRGTHRFVYM